ncbi:MAG: response regulator, partial [Myxococcota bacterium]
MLVVDDEEAIRDLLQEYLEGRGYRVVVAWDGEEGIEVFKRSRAQLAIVDFLLPKKNGFAVADAIRHSDAPDVPIIMMSG